MYLSIPLQVYRLRINLTCRVFCFVKEVAHPILLTGHHQPTAMDAFQDVDCIFD
jgi:hypothetical protein